MKPMLCESEIPENAQLIFSETEWICEEKYDGIRACIVNGKIYGRRGRDITKQFPEFDASVGTKDMVIDGEILCDDFSKTQSRVLTTNALRIRLMAKHMPAKFYAFDYVDVKGDFDGELVVRQERLKQLMAMNPKEWLVFAKQGSFDDMWKYVIENAREGVIMKRKDSLYEHGKRSKNWIKVKAFKETEAIFTKLEHHPKGVRLEAPDGKSVNVNGHNAKEVEQIFNKQKYVKCNVQYMDSTDSESDAWRFPSFRGLVK